MTGGTADLPFSESRLHYAGFSEDAAVEAPAIELFQSLGWDHANLYQEMFGTGGTEGRTTMREPVLPNRLWAALQKFNPRLSPEALRDAAAEIARDRSAMLATDASAEIYRMLSEVLPDTTIVSIGHRSTLIALHRRHIEMQSRQGGTFEPTPALLERAAVIT